MVNSNLTVKYYDTNSYKVSGLTITRSYLAKSNKEIVFSVNVTGIAPGYGGAIMFYLPQELRPKYVVDFPVVCLSPNYFPCRGTVNEKGEVLIGMGQTNLPANTACIANISWMVD